MTLTPPAESRASPTPADEGLVLCPVCDALMPADTRMCRICWADLSAGTALSASEARRVREPGQAAARRRRRVRLLRRYAVVAVVVGALALMTYRWADARYFNEIPLLPLASSAERQTNSTADAWALNQGDVAGTRATSAPPALDGEIGWRYQASAPVTAPLVADARAVYVAQSDGRLIAISTRDGSELWTASVPAQLDAAPVIAGDRLFVGFRDGRVVALAAATGEIVWEDKSPDPVTSSPIVIDGTVYVAKNGHMLALDAEDGKTLWEGDIGHDVVLLTPVVEGDRLVVATFKRILFFDRTTGAVTFQLNDLPFGPQGSIAIRDGTVFATPRRQLLAFDGDVQRPWWEPVRKGWMVFHLLGVAPTVPWQPHVWAGAPPREPFELVLDADADQLFVAGAGGEVNSYDTASGEVRWSLRLGTIASAPILTAHGLLVVEQRALVLLDPLTGIELRRRTFDGTALAEAVVTQHGTYLLTETNELLALR